jgi:hypothetical protein
VPRLVEVPSTSPLPERLRLREGDVVRLRASGAAPSDGGVVEVLGPFVPGAPGPDGRILEAAGTPGVVLLVARRPGTATVEIARGDPGGVGGAALSSLEVVCAPRS